VREQQLATTLEITASETVGATDSSYIFLRWQFDSEGGRPAREHKHAPREATRSASSSENVEESTTLLEYPAPTPQLQQRSRGASFLSPGSLLNLFGDKNSSHPRNRENEAINVDRKGKKKRRCNHENSGKASSACSSQKRKTQSNKQVSKKKKRAPQPKHYNDDDGGDSDDSIGSEDSYSSQSEQELQLEGSIKQRTIHSLSSHSIHQKSASSKLPEKGRRGERSEDDDDDDDDKESSSSEELLDPDDRHGQQKKQQHRRQQPRKTDKKEATRALSGNAVRRKNAKQTFARRSESSSDEEEESSSESDDDHGQHRPGKVINKKTAKSLSQSVVRRKTTK
jgi:hypothetical protein